VNYDFKHFTQGKFVVQFDPHSPTRVGIIPRHIEHFVDKGHHSTASNDAQHIESCIKWFDFSSFMMFHTVNAWEHDDHTIKLIGCREPSVALDYLSSSNQTVLHEWTFNLNDGSATDVKISSINVEFPRMNETLLGRRFDYYYVGVFLDKSSNSNSDASFNQIRQIAKFHTHTGKELGRISFGEGRFSGEPVFVPKTNASCEDDGYLLTYIYDTNRNQSDFVIYDAKSMAQQPVSLVQLPVRVPHGFHGIFVTEQQLQDQLART